MKCSEYQNLISAYADDMLTPEEKQELEKHLKKCPACQAEYEVLVEIQKMCQSIEDVDLPERFHEEMMTKIRVEQPQTKMHVIKTKKWSRKWSYGGALVATVCAGLLFINQLKQMPSQSEATSEADTTSMVRMNRSLDTDQAKGVEEMSEAVQSEEASNIDSFNASEMDTIDHSSQSESVSDKESCLEAHGTVKDEKAFEKALADFTISHKLSYEKQGSTYFITLGTQKDEVLQWLKTQCSTLEVAPAQGQEVSRLKLDME